MDIDFLQVGQRIQALRGKQARDDLAHAIRIHPNTLRNYEVGREQPVSVLNTIANHFHITLDWLLWGTHPAAPGEISAQPTLLGETLALAAVPAIQAWCARNAVTDRDLQARILRALMKYLMTQHVTDEVLQNRVAMESMAGLAAQLLETMRKTG
jgi:DNA-binding XRE family transcriptional regulator